jgi:hypothetical protein
MARAATELGRVHRVVAGVNEEDAMLHSHHLSPEAVRLERARAERANYIVSEAISDPNFIRQAATGLDSSQHGVSMLWREFLRWEASDRRHEEAEQVSVLGLHLELRLAPRVRDIVTHLSPADRQLFENSLLALCDNPSIDNITKFAVPSPPIVLALYQDGPFRVVYRVLGDTGVDVLNVGLAPEVPTLEQWALDSKS